MANNAAGSYESIAPTLANLVLGGGALAVALVGFHDLGTWIRWLDVPLNALLFVGCAWVAMAARKRNQAEGAVYGLLLGAAGLAISALVLAFDRTHPWTL